MAQPMMAAPPYTLPLPPPPPALSIVDSLHQSRQTLLRDTFTLFRSATGRAQSPSPSQTPHSLKHFATSTVSVGPHAFFETKLYLCDWSPSSASTPTMQQATLNPAAITPALIARLNAASQTDPALADILRKAASGQASSDELSGLARLIEQLRQEDEAATAAAAAPAQPAAGNSNGSPPAPAHPSLVVEFHEVPGEQYLIPAHYLYTALPPPPGMPAIPGRQDVLLSFFIFPAERFPPHSAKGKHRAMYQPVTDFEAPVPVDVVVEHCTDYARDCLFRASRNGRPKDSKLEDWWRQMINAVPHRTHILYIPPTHSIAPSPALQASPPPEEDSAALSRTGSNLGTPGAAGLAGTKRGGTPKEALGQKKAKVGSAGKAAPVKRCGARSKSSTAISTPAGASPSPGPSSLAGSPEPAYRALGGGRRGSSRAKSRVKSYAEDDDDEFEREMRSLEKKARRGSVKEEA
ncbi:uncharacterized protein RHTO_05791 [Rhodotorula toruloides NP11]|nr:uncharacterized protein RHTO_05791 [Rhodotorula toruloides NP11]EMS18688.1 hypothetical protein RHTO_05791 [Rhodotorula toruloides NP11]